VFENPAQKLLFAGDPVFELYARRAVKGLYKLRNKTTGKCM
jgi:hypothetical protein